MTVTLFWPLFSQEDDKKKEKERVVQVKKNTVRI